MPDWLASGAGSVNSHGVPAGRVSAKGPAGRLANGWPPRTTRASVAKLECQLPPVDRLKYVTQALFTWPGLGEADQCQPWMPPWPWMVGSTSWLTGLPDPSSGQPLITARYSSR